MSFIDDNLFIKNNGIIMIPRMLFLVALFSISQSHATSINLLTNSGFESGDATGWLLGGNSANTGIALDSTLINGTFPNFGDGYSNVRSGSYSAFGTVGAKTTPDQTFFSLKQSVDVDPNSIYDIGFFVGVDHDSSTGFEYRWGEGWALFDEWINISIDGISVLPRVGLPTIQSGNSAENFEKVATTYTTAFNQSQLTVEYRVTASGSGLAGFSVDDFYFCSSGQAGSCFPNTVPIPEPSAIWLFSCGLLGLLALRKNKIISLKISG